MAFHSVLFNAGKLPGYPSNDPPALLPVVFEGADVCNAIFYDHRYSAELPGRLNNLVTNGILRLDFVFQSPGGLETLEYKPGYKLSWLILAEEPDFLEL